LSAKTSEYAEEILSPHFGVMIQFVKEVENYSKEEQQSNMIEKEEGNF